MTRREAAIVTAYTGFLIGEFVDFHEYAERVMGRQIYTHEFAKDYICEELKNKSRNDFISIIVEG